MSNSLRHQPDVPTARELSVGTRTIPYTLTRSRRKSVGIAIHPDLRVDVRAPQEMSLDAIDAALQKRSAWIMRHLHNFAQRPARQPLTTLPHNNTYTFLGRALPLRIEALPAIAAQGGSRRERVEFVNEAVNESANEELNPELNPELIVWQKDVQDQARRHGLLARWSRTQADTVFVRRLAMLFPCMQPYQVTPPLLAIRNMRARWGSCSSNGKITLNLKLIHMDEALIDYVIMHELCHLVEHNHSPRFYALLTQMMPDWKARRHHLNQLGMPQ